SRDFFVHESLLAVVGYRGEAVVKIVEIRLGQRETQLLSALVEGVPPAVLPQHQFALGHADRPRVDNFVSRLLLEVAILMDAGLVRESVAAHNRLVGLRAERNDRAQQLAGRVQMLDLNSSAI